MLQCTKWFIMSVAAVSGIVSSVISQSLQSFSVSAAAAASAQSSSVHNIPAAAGTDDSDAGRQWPVFVVVIVDVIASRAATQLRRAAAQHRLRASAAWQRSARRGHGANGRRHPDHRHIRSTDAWVGRRADRTPCVGCALICQPVARTTSLSPFTEEQFSHLQGLLNLTVSDVSSGVTRKMSSR